MILGHRTCYKHILKKLTCVQSIDTNSTFKKNIDNLVRKAQCKRHALRRIRTFLTIEKAKIVGNIFIKSQFNYAPPIWLFCRKKLYSEIEKIHHRALKVVYGIDDSYNNLCQFIKGTFDS